MARGRTESDNRSSLLKARERKVKNRTLYPRKTPAEMRWQAIVSTAQERRQLLREAEWNSYFQQIDVDTRARVAAHLRQTPDDSALEHWSIAASHLLNQVNADLRQAQERYRPPPQPVRSRAGNNYYGVRY